MNEYLFGNRRCWLFRFYFKKRVIRIVKEILSCDESEAILRLEANEWNIKNAVKR